jgi:uncharacterized protein
MIEHRLVRTALLTVSVVLSTLLPCVCMAQVQTPDEIYESALPLYADSSIEPLSPMLVTSGTYDECTWQKISYQGKTDRLPGLLFLPIGASSSKPVPCLLLLHGLGGRKEQMVPIARFLASIGYACWAIDNVGSGERAVTNAPAPAFADYASFAIGLNEQSQTQIVDLRRGIDYLNTRPEIDHAHIGLMGFSLGALIGGVLAGVDSRVCAVILVSGGGNLGEILVDLAKDDPRIGKLYPPFLSTTDPIALEQSLALDDPLNFVAHISPRPLLMEHGRLDKVILPDNAEALFEAAQRPKQIVWYPNAGHIPPPFDLYPSVSEFLDKYMPVAGR